MRKILSIVIVVISAVVNVAAQTKEVRRHHSEATNVESKQVAKEIEVGNAAFYGTAYSYPAEDFKPGVVRVGPRTTYLKEGLTVAEVVRFLGKPFSISERTQNNTIVKMYSFQRSESRILIAEFENEVLVRSWLETHDSLVAQATR